MKDLNVVSTLRRVYFIKNTLHIYNKTVIEKKKYSCSSMSSIIKKKIVLQPYDNSV